MTEVTGQHRLAEPPAAIPDFSSLRILVVHDWMLAWAGAERTLAEITHVVPQADVVVGARAPHLRNLNAVTRRARETWLARIPGSYRDHRWLLPLQYPAFATLDARGYDLVISSSSAFSKAVRPRPGRPHVCYCYSPPRYLWDLAPVYQETMTRMQSLALSAAAPVLRAADRRSARSVTHFACISRFVAERVRRAYDRDAVVVYPPVAPKPASRMPGKREDFLLVLGRLVQYKRVDLAIAAAERLGIPIVIAGDGPDRRILEAMKTRCATFLGEVDEATAGSLLERCRLFVFCAEEDFGIAPLEANAHGAPVVGYGRGALRETMTSRTAVFFDRQDVDAVAAAIQEALTRRWDEADLQSNAARFSPERFRRDFATVLAHALENAT